MRRLPWPTVARSSIRTAVSKSGLSLAISMSNEPLKELFQQQFVKMVAVISNLFGLQHIELAEDIVSETFLTAAEEWEKKGIPDNPTAWLYTVAKRKTIHLFRRDRTLHTKILPALS